MIAPEDLLANPNGRDLVLDVLALTEAALSADAEATDAILASNEGNGLYMILVTMGLLVTALRDNGIDPVAWIANTRKKLITPPTGND